MVVGTFGERDIRLRSYVMSKRVGGATLLFGLQFASGSFVMDLSMLEISTVELQEADAWRVKYPPVIVEANEMDAPQAFWYLKPLMMDNVVYEVHVYCPGPFTHQLGEKPKAGWNVWPNPEKGWTGDLLREELRPVREFQRKTGCRIYVGESTSIAWAPGADAYLRDCIGLFEKYGRDWTYHAFSEWEGWSVEYEGLDAKHMVPSDDNPRKRAQLEGLRAE